MAGWNYFPSKADTCQFIKMDEGDEPLSFVEIYFDYRGIIGTPKAINEVIKA
jgi:hypothetical protein